MFLIFYMQFNLYRNNDGVTFQKDYVDLEGTAKL